MKTLTWIAIHLAHWLVLYLAFGEDMPGAQNVALFAAWALALVSLFVLHDEAVSNALKSPPPPCWQRAPTQVQSWCTLALFVWFSWFATAAAWGVAMLLAAYHRDRVANARNAREDWNR